MTGKTISSAALALLALAACSSPNDEPKIEDQPLEPTLPAEETVPITEPDAPAYVGVWAEKTDWCGAAPGAAEAAPIVFTEGEFIAYENLCRIGYAEEGTEGGWRLELICQADDVEYTDMVDLDVDGVMLRMRRNDDQEKILTRCEEA